MNAAPQNDFDVESATKEEIRHEFARRVYARMRERGWSQSELSRQSKIEKSNISNYIRGRVSPGSKHLEMLAKALGCQPNDLLPDNALSSAGSELPALEMKMGSDGLVMFRVNQRISYKKALRIMEILDEE